MGEKLKDKGRKIGVFSKSLRGIFLVVFVLVVLVAVVYFALYKSGEASLKKQQQSNVPAIESDQLQIEKITNGLTNPIAWQEGWVAYDGKIYEYDENALNLVIIGVDHEGVMDKQTDFSNWDSGQADTIFLLSMNSIKKKMSITGIPRNAMVNLEIYGKDGKCSETIYNQLCLQYAYAGGGEFGLSKMKERISEIMYGMPVHGVCAISYDALKIVTQSIGGVQVVVPEDMTIYFPGYTKGAVIDLDYDSVLAYLQYRDPTLVGSPSTRLSRQKEFLQAAMYKGISAIKQKPSMVSELYKAVTPYMNTDITMNEAVYIATEALDYDLSPDAFYQISGEDKITPYINEFGEDDFYDDYYLSEDSVKEIMIKTCYKEVILN